MSSQLAPTPLPLVLGRIALATTPQPSSVSIAVPRSSGRKIAEKSTLSSFSGEPDGATVRRQGLGVPALLSGWAGVSSRRCPAPAAGRVPPRRRPPPPPGHVPPRTGGGRTPFPP